MGPYGSVRIAFPPDTEKRDPVFVLKGTANAESAVSFDTYFGPYDPRDKGRRLIGDDRERVSLERDRPEPQFDAQINSITLNFDNAAPMTLHVENMAAPLAALRACVDDLFKSWGLDPAVQKTLSRRAKPLPLTVAELQRHYPANELGKGTNARVRVRIKIDPSGQPTSCVVETKSTDEVFRKTVCDHLKGGFEPALDKDGRAVESVFFTAVNFLGS
jgi:TonB family protein